MTDGVKDSGDVFPDLGFPETEAHALKAKLVRLIGKLIAEAGLTHAEAAASMRISAADLTKMLEGGFDPLSVEHLVGFLMALRQRMSVDCGAVPIAKVVRR
jgi:predicted XRE-type DNA-binding protein